MPSEWKIRLAAGPDLNFIYSTWLNSYRTDSYFGQSTRKSVFYDKYNEIVDAILAKPSTTALVAALPNELNVILGYLIFEPNILHYCFVKESWQRAGIAKSLAAAAFLNPRGAVSFTHRTRWAEPVIARYPSAIYNPFLLFERQTSEKTRKNAQKTE